MGFRRVGACIAVVMGLAAVTAAQNGAQTEKQFQAALQKEMVSGDLKGAIAIYKEVVAQAGSNRALAAKALLRMAESHQKLGDSEAEGLYKRLASDYGDLPEAVEARRRLSPLGSPSVEASQAQDGSIAPPNAGFSSLPSFSPDGRWVAGVIFIGSDTRRSSAIVLRPFGTRADRRLTPELEGAIRGVSFSPDSARVAAILAKQPGTRPGGQTQVAPYEESVVVVPVGTQVGASKVIPVWSGGSVSDAIERFRDPVWSPNGLLLPVVSNLRGQVEVQVIDALTGSVRTVGQVVSGPPDFQWSPDGRELAWHVSNPTGGANTIHVVDIASGSSRRVDLQRTEHEQTRLGPWGPSGEIAVTHLTRGEMPAATRMSLLRLADGRIRPGCIGYPLFAGRDTGVNIFGGAVDLCLPPSRDGESQLVWKAQPRRLFVRDIASQADRPLVEGFAEERGVSVSPDGRVVLFASNRDATWALYYVTREPAAPARPVLLSRLDDVPRQLDAYWVAGGAIVVARYEEGQVLRVTMDPLTGKSVGDPSALTQDSLFNVAPAISPDGRQIAYVSRRNGILRPAVMNADGSGERVLDGPVVMNYRLPILWRSPESFIRQDLVDAGGARYEFLRDLTTASGTPRFEYFLLDARTGARTLISGPAAIDRAGERGSWSFDLARQEIVYPVVSDAKTGSLEFRAQSIVTGGDRLVASLPSAGAPLDHFVLSADGKRLVYLLSTQFTGSSECAPCELGIINLETGAARRLSVPSTPQVPAAISPDNRFLLFGGARPRVMDLSSGQHWPLMADPAKQPGWDQMGSWSPDGTFIVLSADYSNDVARSAWRRFQIK